MKTKELNTNKTMRTGLILAVIAIVTLIALAMTFAKYASHGTGEDNARVAKWGLNAFTQEDLDLFDASYTNPAGTTTTVDSSDHANVIAPGTTKSTNITLATFDNDQAPEVMYHFEPSVDVVDTNGQSLTAQLDALPGWYWTVGSNGGTSKDYKTVADLKAVVAGLQEKDIDPNTMPKTQSIQLGWKWIFEKDCDASDTELGNLIAQADLSSMKVTLNLKAYQCQGGCTVKPIQYAVDGTAVTFLPAYSGDVCPYKFYTKNGNEYKEIEGITNMASLASKIGTKEAAANVYTNASGAKFYGTIKTTWDAAFDPATVSGDADGLNSDFKKAIDTAGVKTVYGDYKWDEEKEQEVWVKDSSQNWDAPGGAGSKISPTLNGVEYIPFYKAYTSLLNGRADAPWSSFANSSTLKDAFVWYTSNSYWSSFLRSGDFAAVLSKTF